jgi:uncharacterized protein YndB with AHSA1/START domain
MFVAHAHAVIPAPGPVVWRHLTTGADLACWFADAHDLQPAAPVRFSFGDGDFFTGHVTRWSPPHELALAWRFMGIGPTFDIQIVLSKDAGGTAVAVSDSGALSPDAAASLRDGWQDFLSRLATFASSGRRTRFLWSESIETGALLRSAAGRADALVDSRWLHRWFPDVVIDRDEHGDGLTLTFRDPAWCDLTTVANVRSARVADGVYLEVVHSGWPALPEARRFAERKRYAGLWCAALGDLESTHA